MYLGMQDQDEDPRMQDQDLDWQAGPRRKPHKNELEFFFSK